MPMLTGGEKAAKASYDFSPDTATKTADVIQKPQLETRWGVWGGIGDKYKRRHRRRHSDLAAK